MKIFDFPDLEVYLYEDFLTKEEAKELMSILETSVSWQQDEIKIFGKAVLSPRLTAWYGDENCIYSYSGKTHHPQVWTAPLLSLKNKIEQSLNRTFNSVLLNFYRDGNDSIGWHQDNEKELGKNPVIASLSLGQERGFKMKHIHNKDIPTVNIPLSSGSLLLMKGNTQDCWKHQIPKTKTNIGKRINLTFRRIFL